MLSNVELVIYALGLVLEVFSLRCLVQKAAEVVTTFGGDATKAETEEREGAQATETKQEQGKRSASSEGPAAKRTCRAGWRQGRED